MWRKGRRNLDDRTGQSSLYPPRATASVINPHGFPAIAATVTAQLPATHTLPLRHEPHLQVDWQLAGPADVGGTVPAAGLSPGLPLAGTGHDVRFTRASAAGG
jgi:hypothetical protein